MPKLTAESSGYGIKASATFVKYQKNKFEIFAFVLLAILAFFILFYNLGATPVQNWDEGFYSLMARDTGRYGAIPSLNGELWLEKPPLGVWFIALSFRILGYSAFSLRLPSAIFALGNVLLLFLLGKKIASLWTGFFASLMFLVSPVFLYPHHMARTGDLDTMLLFTTIAAFLFYVYSWEKPKMLIGSGAMIGLGFMLRGSPMLIIGFIIALHALITRKQRPIPFKFWVLWIAAAGAVALPWHLYAFVTHPSAFINFYLSSSLFGRVFGVIDEHSGPVGFYHGFLKQQLGLLFILLYCAALWLFRKSWKGDAKSLLILLWIIVPSAIISVMKTKLFWYVMPILPAIFLSIAILVRDISKDNFQRLAIFLSGFLALLWILNIPANLAGWGLERRVIVLAIVFASALLVNFSIKKFRNASSINFSQTTLFLMVIISIFNGATVSAKTVFTRAQEPSIKLIAEQAEKEGAKNILVSAPEYAWIRGWLIPQAEYYLNIENSLQGQYAQAEFLLDKAAQTKSSWIIADDKAFQLLQTHYQNFRVAFEKDKIFLVELK